MTFLNELIPVDGAEIGDRTNFGSIKGLKSWVFLLNWKLARAYPSLFVIHLNYGWVKTYARKRKVMHLLYIREESWEGRRNSAASANLPAVAAYVRLR